jgi:RimJ/RimL family protein N-acetyltransferase
MTEAVRAITSIAFDALGARRVEIRCDPSNLKSARVAERAGFTLEGTLHNNELGTDGTPPEHPHLLPVKGSEITNWELGLALVRNRFLIPNS